MLYSISKKSSSRHELKKIMNIRAKASKKVCHSSSDYSIENLDSNSFLASDIS